MMNQTQTKISIAAGVVVIAMLLFPPFSTSFPNGVAANEGYSFILSPPKSKYDRTPSVNISMLLMQWVGVGVAAAIAIAVTSKKR